MCRRAKRAVADRAQPDLWLAEPIGASHELALDTHVAKEAPADLRALVSRRSRASRPRHMCF